MNKTQRSALIVAVISSFITPFMISSVNVALPAIEAGFNGRGVSAVLLSWVATSYLLAAGVSLLPMGRLADIVGRKKIMGYGLAFSALASLFCSLAPDIISLLFFRTVQGLGGGMIFGTSMAILTSVFPPRRRGRVIGLAVTSVYMGLMSGPFIGGLLTHYLGWRILFLTIFILGMIPLVLLYFYLEGEWADAAGEEYDMVGLFLYVPSLIAIIYGVANLQQLYGISAFGGGCCGFTIFVYRQKKTEYPLFKVDLFLRNKPFALSNAAALIHYSATFAITFLLSFYLQYIKGFDARMTGFILITQPLMMVLFSATAGRLSDGIEPRILSSIGMAITAIVLFMLSFLGSDSSIPVLAGLLAVLGFGFAAFSSPNMNAIMGAVEPRYLGIAAGASGTMRVLGQVLSMGIATLILALYVGDNIITLELYPDLLRSIRCAFIVFGVLCLVGLYASLKRGKIHGKA